jgi:4-hydroxy-3-polyprenylbenzoate decarboxylase
MEQLAYHDLRSFVEAAKKVSDWRQIDGADWDGEIGALVESAAELVPQPPMLIFDKIKGYPAGYRVLSLPYAAYKRVALSFGLSTEMSKLELVRAIARKIKSAKPIPAARGENFADYGKRDGRRPGRSFQVPRASVP